MSSTLPEHGNNQDSPTDDSILNSFNLFLSLMTPLEFTKLLQSRVKHLLQTWPSPSSTAKESYHKTHSSDHEPLALSMESIRSLTSFFRMQDTPTSPESSTLSSQSNIHQHLVALETLLSCLSPKELQRLIQSRLKEGGRERTAAIRGLLDVMRSAANDETPENQTRSGSSVLRINLRSDSEDNGTPSTNTCPVNLSPGTAPIPRVMSPGTRDQSADDSINTPQGDPPKSHPSPQTIMEQSNSSNRQSIPFRSPTVSTSKISSPTDTNPFEHASARDALEPQIEMHSTKSEAPSVKGKGRSLESPSHSNDSKVRTSAKHFPYTKLIQPSRKRTRSTVAPTPQSSAPQTRTKPEKPRRKSERLSMKNQPSTRSDGSFITSKQSPKKGPTISSGYSSDAKPTLTSLATPLSPSHVTPNTTSDHASSFPYTQADGRKSPPRPVLRAVDWSNPVRSSSLSSDEDGEEIDEEEEFDELADDTSEADSRVPEIVDGWNSHMADEETEKVVHSSLNDPSGSMRQVSPFSPYQPNKDEGKELAPDEVILTLPSEPDSLEPQAPPSSDSFKAAETKANIPSDQKKDDESVVSVTLDHDMDVDLPSGTPSAIPPPTLSAPDAGFPPQPPSQSPSVYPSYYASPPPSADLPHQAPIHGVSHSSQPPSMHPHHHASHMPNVPPSPYPPSQLHQNVNPYPPPTHTYGYHHPQPPPPHMAAYPPHHSTYTTPSWYSNSYFPPHNHQPVSSQAAYPPHNSISPYPPPQQPNVPIPPAQDHHSVHMPPPHHLSHSQPYGPSHYSLPLPQVTPSPFHSTQNSQVSYPLQPSQSQYPPQDIHGSFPLQMPLNQFHLQSSQPSFSTSATPATVHTQAPPPLVQPAHSNLQSTSAYLQHPVPPPQSHIASSSQPTTTFPSSQTQFSPPDNSPLDTFASDPNRSDPQSISNMVTVSIPRPPSPIIPPPSGPRPPPSVIALPPPQRRSPSPPVKPPEAPKRPLPRPKHDEEGNLILAGNGEYEDPNVRYTDEVGIKETSIVRRRCHNCHSAEAPSWRKSKLHLGKILCNKCGIYESTHMMARPLKTRPRRLILNGERDYHFEVFKNSSPITPSGSPTSGSMKRRKKRRESLTSDNDDEFDLDE